MKSLKFVLASLCLALVLQFQPGSLATSSARGDSGRRDNSPPVIAGIPDQLIEVGGVFEDVSLDDFVEDPEDPDPTLSWTAEGIWGDLQYLSVEIVDRVASIAIPDTMPWGPGLWYGSEAIIFTATDPGGLADSDTVAFTAQVELRWAAPAPCVQSGETSSLSVWTDDPIELRTVAVWIEYDPSVITSLGAHKGALFNGPYFTWEHYEDISPNQWHGFASVMGADYWVTGPGELLVWDFSTTTSTGATAATTVDVQLFYPTPPTTINDVILPPSVILVGDPCSDPPVVAGIPDQTISEGEAFASIVLDDYVQDDLDPDENLVWTYAGNIELTVDIVDRVASVSPPSGSWTGSETITFIATDTGGLPGSDSALFTVNPLGTPVPPAVNEDSSFVLAPNPFNPGTTLSFSLGLPGPARILLFDLAGNQLGTVWEGWSNGTPLTIGWNGRAGDGRLLPSGVYLFKLEGPGGQTSLTKGLLLK
jgi:hypothetical protein